jgi:ferredoxin
MRCHICNATLSPAEVQYNRDHEDWDPCGTCLDAIGDIFNDDDEDAIDAQLIFEELLEETASDDEATAEPAIE